MSFFRHGEIYRSDEGTLQSAGSDPRLAPRPIVSMSLQLAIPRRVALQQSPPPLHQPSAILKEKRLFEKENPLNGKCANSRLSQQRGSPQTPVPKLCQNPMFFVPLGLALSEKQIPQIAENTEKSK